MKTKFHKGKVAPEKKKKKKKKKRGKSKQLPRWEEFASELDMRGKKLDIAADICERSVEQDEIEKEKFCDVPEEKRQDLFFRLLCFMETIDDDDEGSLTDQQSSDESSDEPGGRSGNESGNESVGESGAESDAKSGEEFSGESGNDSEAIE